MGIRLYPNTQKSESLEKLAGVPEGTMTRLEALRSQFRADDPTLGFFEREAEYERFYNAKADEPDLDNLDSFILFGWGRVRSPEHQDENGFGRIDISDIDAIRALFARNGIDPALAELTEGVHWG